MSKHFDATLKDMLDAYAADWVRWLAPQLGLPDEPVTSLDPDLSTVQPVADKVFRFEGPEGGLLHLELQSTHDKDLSDRLLVYNVLLHRKYGRPVTTIAFLLRPDAAAMSLTGRLIWFDRAGKEYLIFDYHVVRLWEMSERVL